MAVTNLTVKVQYTGDGGTTVFAITPAMFIDPNDLAEPLIDLPLGDMQVWIGGNSLQPTPTQQASGFTVNGPGAVSNPSSVVFTSAPAAGALITIIRQMPLTQLSRFLPGAAISPSQLEEGFDKLTLICQQLQEELNRAVLANISVIGTPGGFTLPSPIANYYIGWDPTGTFLVDIAPPVLTMAIGGGTAPFRVFYDTAYPTSKNPSDYAAQGLSGSTWNVGDTCYNTAPAVAGYEGWKCTTGGSHGTAQWAPFGQVSAIATT